MKEWSLLCMSSESLRAFCIFVYRESGASCVRLGIGALREVTVQAWRPRLPEAS